MKDKKVVVTGGAGFVGCNLVKRLLRGGYRVAVVDSLRNALPETVQWLMTDGRVNLHILDVRDLRSLDAVFEGVGEVYHLAANADVPFSVADPEYDFTTNVIGTKNVFELCLKHKVGRVLFTSSAAVYGLPSLGVKFEEGMRLKPISPYGASKVAGEALAVAYHHSYGLPIRIVRLFNVYGPGQRHYVMVDLYRKLLESGGVSLEVLGDGMQVRDYLFVDDAVEAMCFVHWSNETAGRVFNVAGSDGILIKDLVKLILKVLGIEPTGKVSYTGESWKGDIPVLEGDVEELEALGWEKKVPLEDGLRLLFDDLARRYGPVGG